MAERLIRQCVEEKFTHSKDTVLQKAFKISGQRLNDQEAKEVVVIHILSILQTLTQTRNKNLIDSLNFEDMI